MTETLNVLHKQVTVTYVDGDKKLHPVKSEYGQAVTKINGIKVSGKNFIQWCADSDCTKPYDFSQPIYEDTTI